MFEYAVTNLKFSSEEEIEVEKDSLLILVGPNNCGKSRALVEINRPWNVQLKRHSPGTVVIKEIKTVESGTTEDILDWLDTYYSAPFSSFTGPRSYVTLGKGPINIDEQYINQAHKKGDWPSSLSEFLTHLVRTEDRLAFKQIDRIDVYSEAPKDFLHMLEADIEKSGQISSEIREAFGTDLQIDSTNPRVILFRVGDASSLSELDKSSAEYVYALRQMPILENDGDGIRSYIGCLLAVKCGAYKILLIDEPEAFLHPPQARRLARLLAEDAKSKNRQIIIGTHSSDVIRGALSSSGKVAVCRIDRVDDKNHAFILSSDELKALWEKPLLKSSGAVEGIFHKGVVVCESDADCRFYESLLLRLEANGAFKLPADLHFIHGGGKGELPTLSQSYKQLKVPVAVIADFDVLRDKNVLKRLVDVLEGDFSTIEKQYQSASRALAGLPPITSWDTFLLELHSLIDAIEEKEKFTNADRRNINELFENARKWSQAKKRGIDKLDAGAKENCEALLAKLKELGLFIVPSGEMESWDRSLPSDKNKWIKEALNNIDDDSDSFQPASEFVGEVADFLGIKLNSNF